MAKPHKFAWNGIDVETVLSFEQLANMAQRAAQECAGDLLHGKQRIASTRSSERQIEFRISDFLITFKKFLVFHLDFEPRNGRNWMSSWIDWYVTTRPTVGGFILVAAKTMSGHNTYLEFVRHLAAQAESADPQARVIIREGVAVSGSAAGSDPPAQGTKASMPDPVIAGPPTASSIPGDTSVAGFSQPVSVPPPALPAASFARMRRRRLRHW